MTLHPIVLNRHGDAPAFVIEHNTKDAWRLRHQRTGRTMTLGDKVPTPEAIRAAERLLLAEVVQ
jgi:hypothetical protein